MRALHPGPSRRLRRSAWQHLDRMPEAPGLMAALLDLRGDRLSSGERYGQHCIRDRAVPPATGRAGERVRGVPRARPGSLREPESADGLSHIHHSSAVHGSHRGCERSGNVLSSRVAEPGTTGVEARDTDAGRRGSSGNFASRCRVARRGTGRRWRSSGVSGRARNAPCRDAPGSRGVANAPANGDLQGSLGAGAEPTGRTAVHRSRSSGISRCGR